MKKPIWEPSETRKKNANMTMFMNNINEHYDKGGGLTISIFSLTEEIKVVTFTLFMHLSKYSIYTEYQSG